MQLETLEDLRSHDMDIRGRERQLVEAIRRGDELASAPLYPYLRPSIERGIRRAVKHDFRDFEDLVQQTLEQVVRGIRKGRFHGHSTLKTWAHSIAANVALDAVRRNSVERRYLACFDADVGQFGVSPALTEARLEARSSLRLVCDVLSRMNPLSAKATVLRHALGYAVADVGRELGLSTTASASRIRRGHAELNRRLNCRVTER